MKNYNRQKTTKSKCGNKKKLLVRTDEKRPQRDRQKMAKGENCPTQEGQLEYVSLH